MSGISRRQLLAGSAHAALFAGLGGGGRGALVAALGRTRPGTRPAATPPGPNARPTVHDARPNAPFPRPATYSFGTPVAPLAVIADVTMSQDLFMSADVLLGDATDSVSPVIVDGALGAIVLQNGIPYVLRPDPTVPTGWTFAAFAPAGTPTIDQLSAVTLDDGSVYVTMLYLNGQWAMTGLLRNGQYTPVANDVTALCFIPPQPTVSPGNDPYLVSWSGGITSGGIGVSNSYVVQTPDGSASPSFVSWNLPGMVESEFGELAVAGVRYAATTANSTDAYAMLVDAAANTFFVHDDELRVMRDLFDGSPLQGPVPIAPAIGSPNPADPSTVAAFLFNDDQGNPWVATSRVEGMLTAQVPLGQLGTGTIGTVTNAAWFADGAGTLTAYLVAGGDADGNGSVLWIQTIDLTASSPVAVQPIPIGADVVDVHLPQRGVTSSTALFARSIDTTLQILTRSTVTGAWSSAPVQQGSTTNQDVTTYRTMLTVVDATGAPCPGIDLQITPSYDQAVWQPTGSTFMTGGSPTTFTTDSWGVVTLATPAVALHSATLSITSTNPAFPAQPVVVSPDAELHAYLAGTGPLLDNPALTGATLQSATASDGSPLCPMLQSTAADTTVSVINQAMQAGAAAQAAGGSSASLVARTPAGARRAGPALGSELGDWWDDVKHDVESVFKAVESGVVKVAEATVEYAAEAGAWVVNLAIEIGDAVVSAIEYTISDLKSAAVAVAGILRSIGADIGEAIKWLRTIVLDLFEDVVAFTDVLYSWLTVEGPNALDGALATAAGITNGLFTAMENDIGDALTHLPGGSFSSTKPAAPAPGSSSAHALGSTTNVKTKWLHDKVKHTTGPSVAPTVATTHSGNIIATLTAQADDAVTGIETAFADVSTALTDPSQFMTNGWVDIADGIGTLLTTALGVMDDIVVDALGLVGDSITATIDAFSEPLGTLPGIGDLFDLVGLENLTGGKLVCALVAFPAVVVGDLIAGVAGGDRSWIPSDSSGSRSSLRGTSVSGDAAPAIELALCLLNIEYGEVYALVNTALIAAEVAAGVPVPTPWLITVSLGILQLLINLLEYPFSTVVELDGPHDAWVPETVHWGSGFIGVVADQAPVITWAIGFVPDAVSALPIPGPLMESITCVVNTYAGIVLTGLSCGIGFTSGATPEELGEDVIGWLTSVVAVLAMPTMVTGTFGITGAVNIDITVLESDTYAALSLAQFVEAV